LTTNYPACPLQKRIKSLKDNLAETAGISSLRVIKEHEKIAFSSIAHLHNTWLERTEFERLTDDQKACIKNISTKIVKRNICTNDEPDIVDVEYVKIELYDKQKSLDSINAMLGYAALKIAKKLKLVAGVKNMLFLCIALQTKIY